MSQENSFKLSATLEGHEQDVRSLVAPYNDTIISASRDSTVRIWTLDNGLWKSRINFTSNGFVNSVAFDEDNQLVISGGQDSLVNITDLYPSGNNAKYVLIGHKSNVCCLDYSQNQIISGSWDCTAKVWQDNSIKYNLVGHNAAVWDVKILGENRYLTSSADRTIKLWEGDKEIKNIVGHQDVVRGLTLLSNGEGFASSSNDGTIRVWSFDGELIKELVGHDSFVYSVKLLSNGDLVSTSEDRTVRIWKDGKTIQVITLPCVSVWTADVLPNDDIVVGGSDGVIRIFTKDPNRVAPEFELQEFHKSVESVALSSKEFDESHVKSEEALNQPGSKEGQVIVVKSAVGVNEAHQWTEGKWQKIGEVVSGASSGNKKQEFEGKKWDYVFDVDVKDGVPPLKLPYNVNENPYQAAERFLLANELPTSYVEEIVRFITDNTQDVSLSQSTANPYSDTQEKKIIPQLEYLGFTTDNSQSILKGIKKFNETETKKFSDTDISDIERYLTTKDIEQLSKTSEYILTNWDNKLPAFDLLRLIIARANKPPNSLSEFLKIGLDKTQNSIYFMTLRLLNNVFLNTKWGESIITDNLICTKILDLLETSLNGIEEKNKAHVASAGATLILNFTIYVVKFKSMTLLSKLLQVLASAGPEISEVSSEAAYRLSVAYGNLIHISKEVKYSPEYNRFKSDVLDEYQEQRFDDVFKEV